MYFRILNYIDIDCGPIGECPDHVLTSRRDFKTIFERAWTKTVGNLQRKTFSAEKMKEKIEQKCFKEGTMSKKSYLICKSTFLLFTLANGNLQKSQNLAETILQNLTKVNLFKEIRPKELNEIVVSRIEKEINFSSNFVDFNWTCFDGNCTKREGVN